MLAAGCAALQAQLASEAMAVAEELPDADALDPGGLLLRATAGGARARGGGAAARGGALDGVGVRAPSLRQLRLA